MQNNKIYKLPLNSNFDETIKNFQDNVLSENEQIVSTSVADIGDSSYPQKVLIVVTREIYNSNRNLLLEERRNKKLVLGGPDCVCHKKTKSIDDLNLDDSPHDSFCPVPANENKSPEFKRYGVYCTCQKKPLLDKETKKELKKVLEKHKDVLEALKNK